MQDERAVKLFADYPKKMLDRFKTFIKENPEIFSEFTKLATQMKNTGREHYSSMAIVQVIRWHRDLAEKNGLFKLNNDFVPMLARLLIWQKPEFENFFELRAVRYIGVKSEEERKREGEQHEETNHVSDF